MIEAYYRPETLEEAIRILQQNPQSAYPLGGGNVLSRREGGQISVVDLQRLKLDAIEVKGGKLSIGANACLQALVESETVPQAVRDAAAREGSINLRQTSTVAGALVSSRGVSPLGAALAVLGAAVVTEPGGKSAPIEEWMRTLEQGKPASLVVRVELPAEVRAAYLDISKTPADVPMAYAAAAVTGAGEKAWVIGFNKEPSLFVGKNLAQADAVKNAHSHFANMKDYSNYHKNMISVLFERLSADLAAEGRN